MVDVRGRKKWAADVDEDDGRKGTPVEKNKAAVKACPAAQHPTQLYGQK